MAHRDHQAAHLLYILASMAREASEHHTGANRAEAAHYYARIAEGAEAKAREFDGLPVQPALPLVRAA